MRALRRSTQGSVPARTSGAGSSPSSTTSGGTSCGGSRPTALEDAPAWRSAWWRPATTPRTPSAARRRASACAGPSRELPESFREVVVLRCVEGFSYRDLATILGCPAGTVMSRLARARALLRREPRPRPRRRGTGPHDGAAPAFRQFVTAYVDGELVGEDRAAFEAHLAACPPCRRLLEEEQAVAALLRSAQPLPKLPPRCASVSRRPGRAPRRPACRGSWLAAAAGPRGVAAAVLAVGPSGAATPAAPARLRAFASPGRRHAPALRPRPAPSRGASRPPRADLAVASRAACPSTSPCPTIRWDPASRSSIASRAAGSCPSAATTPPTSPTAWTTQPLSLLVTSSSPVTPEGGELVAVGQPDLPPRSGVGPQVITWSDNGLTYALASDVTVSGARSCLVCHGSPEERRRVQGFPKRPRT